MAGLVTLGCLGGCEPAPPPPKSGIEIKAPGVNVKINQDGVDVKAPGTKVEVNKDGVNVQAPGADVKLNP